MKFEETNRISHPASLVLETMVERMEEIVPFLPNVESIETREREELPDGRLRIVRYWQGTSDSVPSAVRPFLKKEHMGWLDTALWTPSEFKVDWTLTTSFSKLYDCGGTNRFHPHPDDVEASTEVVIAGELEVFPHNLPGVPRFLGSRLAPQIEKFVVKLVTPNLLQLADGLQDYLDGKQG